MELPAVRDDRFGEGGHPAVFPSLREMNASMTAAESLRMRRKVL